MTERVSYPTLIALNRIIQNDCERINNDYFRCKGLNGENPALCIEQNLAVKNCADNWYLTSLFFII
jgi:hypothetical protein